jgi:hypothetical protein
MIAPPPIDPDHHDHDKKEVVKVSLKKMAKGRLIVSDDDGVGAPPHKKKMEAVRIERLARADKACSLEGAEHGQKSNFRLLTARLGEISFLLIQQIHSTDAIVCFAHRYSLELIEITEKQAVEICARKPAVSTIGKNSRCESQSRIVAEQFGISPKRSPC